MWTAELQNSIIKKVLKTKDNQLLYYLHSLLQKGEESSFYSMTEWEKKVVEKSILDYEKGDIIKNEDVFNKNEE